MTTKRPEPRGHKTSLELPEALWRRAKIRAIDEPGGLRAVIVRALTQFLDASLPARGRKKGKRT